MPRYPGSGHCCCRGSTGTIQTACCIGLVAPLFKLSIVSIACANADDGDYPLPHIGGGGGLEEWATSSPCGPGVGPGAALNWQLICDEDEENWQLGSVPASSDCECGITDYVFPDPETASCDPFYLEFTCPDWTVIITEP